MRNEADIAMEWLVTIHVLAAVLGIGPTYFGHILLRKKQRRDQLLQSLSLFGQLNYFPKIGGSLAVVSGILLVALTGWKFSDLWILGSLILYVLVQVVAVGMLGPVLNRLIQTLNGAKEQERDLSADSSALLARANRLYNTASTMGTILILLMIVKPM